MTYNRNKVRRVEHAIIAAMRDVAAAGGISPTASRNVRPWQGFWRNCKPLPRTRYLEWLVHHLAGGGRLRLVREPYHRLGYLLATESGEVAARADSPRRVVLVPPGIQVKIRGEQCRYLFLIEEAGGATATAGDPTALPELPLEEVAELVPIARRLFAAE